MAVTDISLCSRALVLLGAGSISSFTEESDRATICANAYPGLRDGLLSKHPWRFLMTKKELTRDAADPIGEWSKSFILPGEAIGGAPHVVFYWPGGRLGQSDYEIFGRRLFTNADRVLADFVAAKPESEWPAYFQSLVVYALMAEIAFAITDQQNVADYWHMKAYGTPSEAGLGGEMGVAMSIDSQGQGNIGVQANAFIDARHGGGGAAFDFQWPGNS